MLNREISNIGLLRSIQKAREAANQDYVDSADTGFTVSRPVSYRTYDAKQKRDAQGKFSKGFASYVRYETGLLTVKPVSAEST